MPPLPVMVGTLGALATLDDDQDPQQTPPSAPQPTDPLEAIDALIGTDRRTFTSAPPSRPRTHAPAPKKTTAPAPPAARRDPFAEIDAFLAQSEPAAAPVVITGGAGRDVVQPVESGTDHRGVPTLIPALSRDGRPTHVPGFEDLVGPAATLGSLGYQPRPMNPTPPPPPAPQMSGRLGSAKTGGMATEPPAGQGIIDPATVTKPITSVAGAVGTAFSTVSGAFRAVPTAIGETLDGHDLPGHGGESRPLEGPPPSYASYAFQTLLSKALPPKLIDLGQRLAAHWQMVASGKGGSVSPISVTDPLIPTPDSYVPGETVYTEDGAIQRPGRVRSRSEMVALETGRLGVNLVVQMVTDPTIVALGGVEGIAGEIMAAAFSVDGVAAAVKTASDPHATAEDVAEAILGAAVQTLPLGARHVIPKIRERLSAKADTERATTTAALDALGISAKVARDPKAVRDAYIEKAKITHPDVNDSPNAADQFRALHDHYQWLGDHPPADTPRSLISEWKDKLFKGMHDWFTPDVPSGTPPGPGENITTSGRRLPGETPAPEPPGPAYAAVTEPPVEHVPALGPDAVAGPAKPDAPVTGRTAEAEALYEASKAELTRTAAAFKQTSVAAKDNAEMAARAQHPILSEVDRVLAEAPEGEVAVAGVGTAPIPADVLAEFPYLSSPGAAAPAAAPARHPVLAEIDRVLAEPSEKPQYSSTQVNLGSHEADAIRALGATIPKTDLASDGRETNPHITVKYGLHTDEVANVRRVLADEQPVTVTFGKTSVFKREDHDLVKVDIDSADLHRLNKKIAAALEHTDTFPDYKPHATVAYVKPGLGAKYAGNDAMAGQSATINALTFSGKDGKEVTIPLGGKPKSSSEMSDDEMAAAVTKDLEAQGHTVGAEPTVAPTSTLVEPHTIKAGGVEFTAQPLRKKPVTPQIPAPGGGKYVVPTFATAQYAKPALTRELAGATPRYNVGLTSYEPKFESDVDKAAYILAQKTPSKRDADYLTFVMNATGLNEAGARALGSSVRARLKMLSDSKPKGGTLYVADVWRPKENVDATQEQGARNAKPAEDAGSREAGAPVAPAQEPRPLPASQEEQVVAPPRRQELAIETAMRVAREDGWISQGFDPKRLTIHERRELGRIEKELDNVPFVKHGFIDAGLGKGGNPEIVPGAAGAAVFNDIGGTGSRAEILQAVRDVLAGKVKRNGQISANSQRAIMAARDRIVGKSGISKPTFPPDAGNESGVTYVEPTRDLTPEEATHERAFRDAVENKTDRLVTEYRKRFGNVVDADKFKELYKPYAQSDASRGALNRAIHKASSAGKMAVYRQMVQEPPQPGQLPSVTFVAGGPEAGKSTVTDNPAMKPILDAEQIVVDGPLSNVKVASGMIRDAIDAGKHVTIMYVHRDPVDAWTHGVQSRAKRKPPIDYHINSHVTGLEAIRTLYRQWGDHPDVHFEFLENKRGEAVTETTLDKLPEAYNKGDVRSAIEASQPAAAEGAGAGGAIETAGEGRSRGADGSVPQARPAEEVAPSTSASVDVLDTGEQQPRLPGDVGQVRDREVPTPAGEAPFSLTPEPAERGAIQPPLISEPPEQSPQKRTRGGGGGGNAMAASPSSGFLSDGAPPSRPPRPPAGSGGPPAPRSPLPKATGISPPKTMREFLEAARFALRATSHPEGLGPDAVGTAGTIRHEGALSERRLKVVEEQFKPAERKAEKLTPEELLPLIDAAERGRSTGDPDWDAAFQVLHDVTEPFTKELIDLDRLKAESAIENWIGRYWNVDPHQAQDFLRRASGKRPVEGPKSFMRQRTWQWMADGVRAILEAKARIAADTPREGDAYVAAIRPATYNPFTAQRAKLAEIQRVITSERELRYEASQGRAKKILDTMGIDPPRDVNGDKWVIPDRNDAAFTIYGPKSLTVKEAYDPKIMKGLHQFALALGVRHVRKIAVGGNRWGYAVGKDQITTKFAGPEGVLMHEIGHILDEKYGLRGQWVNNLEMKKELRALADLRDEGQDVSDSRKRYVRKGQEKIANLVHGFLYMPERTKKVAPRAYWALHNLAKAHPELEPLLDLQKHGRSLRLEANTAELQIPGIPPVVGHWYVPKASAAIWQNAYGKGLRGNPLYDLMLAPKNAATQIMLGFSAFHLANIMRQGFNVRLGLAMESLINRHDVVGAARHLGTAPFAPVIDAIAGYKLLTEYRRPGTYPELAGMLDGMLAGGYRGNTGSEFWTGEQAKKLKQHFKDLIEAESVRQGVGAAVKLPVDVLFAGVEMFMHPLMAKYVPWMKAAAARNAVVHAMNGLPSSATLDEVREVAGDTVKRMDYIFGQVAWVNHFLNPVMRDLVQLAFLAPGWTGGTLTMAGRAVSQVAGATKKSFIAMRKRADGSYEPAPSDLLGPDAAYWMGSILGLAFISGLLTYVLTGGDTPHGKDYFFYRDGSLDVDGNPNRHTMPGYERDMYGWGKHPADTFVNKLNPNWAFVARAVENRNYFGDMYYNPDAPSWHHLPVTQIEQLATAAYKDQGRPLSVQNFEEARRRGEGGTSELVRNAFGISPAKREIVRTPSENKMAEYLSRQGHLARTPEEVAEADQRRELREALRTKNQAKVQELRGQVTTRQAVAARKSVGQTFLQRGFPHLSIGEALSVYEMATPEERAQVRNALIKKAVNVAPAGRAAVLARRRAALSLPVGSAKAGAR